MGKQKQWVSLEIFYFLRIRSDREGIYIDILILDPAHMLIGKLIHADFYIIFILQAVLQNLKLEDAHYTHDNFFHSGIKFLEDLNGTLQSDLGDSLHKLFPLHGIHLADPGEVLWGKGRYACIADIFPGFAQCIADGKDPRIKNTDDISCIGLFHMFALLRHHLLGLCQTDLFAALDMHNLHSGGEFAGADTHKCDAVPVGFVHICLNLENKSRKILRKRIHGILIGKPGERRGGHFQKML